MRVDSFIQLGKIFAHIGDSKPWDGHHLGVNEKEFEELENAIHKSKIYNGWFDEHNVRLAFKHLSVMLGKEELEKWTQSYSLPENNEIKTIALIMAGNIPMVGFHDLLCVLISGNKALIKLSSDDSILLPQVLEVLLKLNPEFSSQIEYSTGKLEGFDAVIATGSNNSARYFETYFDKYPSIVRKNRTSVAVLDGSESEEELEKLADDVFVFYGLGCRNISKVFLPEGFDLNKLFKTFFKYKDVIDNKKYANNYDYNKAVYMMNKVPILENGFLLLKEDEQLNSPLSVLFHETYKDIKQLQIKLNELSDDLQCIVGVGGKSFGDSQIPRCFDYADNVDVMAFLSDLDK